MARSSTKNLTRKQVNEFLNNSECLRVPDLDISGGMFESYQLPDGRILIDFSGEGGTIYESRSELEKWLREAEAEQEAFNATLPEPYTVLFDKPLEPSSVKDLEQLDISEYSNAAYRLEVEDLE